MKKSGFFLVLLLLTNCVMATVPHTFTAGTPAKASEVNENFSAIEQRVTDLEISAPKRSIEFSYSPLAAPLGDVVGYIERRLYVLGALSFREYETGGIYKVYIPMERYTMHDVQTSKDLTLYSAVLTTTPTPSKHLDSTFQISGFPAKLTVRETYTSSDDYNKVSTDISVHGQNFNVHSKYVVGLSLYIEIGGTTLIWTPYRWLPAEDIGSAFELNKVVDSTMVPDFSMVATSSELDPNLQIDSLLNQYKDLVNYVRIEKIQ